MVMTYEGTATSQGAASANWVLEQGTGGLTNLHGRGTFDGTLVALQTSRCTPPDPNGMRWGYVWWHVQRDFALRTVIELLQGVREGHST